MGPTTKHPDPIYSCPLIAWSHCLQQEGEIKGEKQNTPDFKGILFLHLLSQMKDTSSLVDGPHKF